MFGGVRTASQTLAAPPVARSCAISIPDEPVPTTNTLLPRYGPGLRYSDECTTPAANESDPGHRGMCAVCWFPVATTTCRVSKSPVEVVTRQPSSWRSMRCTSVPSRSLMPSSPACRSRCATTSSRVGNIGVPPGYGRFGRCENGRPVFSFSRSYRPRHEEPTCSARSINSGRTPRSRRLSATEIPAGPAPTIATSCSVIPKSNDQGRPTVHRARGWAPAQTSRRACTVTMV